MKFDIDKHTIYKVKHGSVAYGLATPESDLDIKGVAIPPNQYFLGFVDKFEQCERLVHKGHPNDEVIYDVRKFFSLAANSNPNICEMLWVDEADILYIDNFGKQLRSNAGLFLSKKARHTFSGYAHAQLKRIKTHKKWLLDPPKNMPQRSDFGLSNTQKPIDGSTFGALNSLMEDGHEFDASVMTVLQNERKYLSAKQHWDQYQNWQKTRNKKRSELEAKYGYDTKHASHLVRLMRMCEEILLGKGVIVKRPDAEELLAIKTQGIWSYDELVEWAEKQDAKMDDLYEKSTLPHSPDLKKLDELCVSLVDEYLWFDMERTINEINQKMWDRLPRKHYKLLEIKEPGEL